MLITILCQNTILPKEQNQNQILVKSKQPILLFSPPTFVLLELTDFCDLGTLKQHTAKKRTTQK